MNTSGHLTLYSRLLKLVVRLVLHLIRAISISQVTITTFLQAASHCDKLMSFVQHPQWIALTRVALDLYLISVSDAVCSLLIVDAYHAHYYILLTHKNTKRKKDKRSKNFDKRPNRRKKNSLMKKIALRENRAANALPLNAGSVIYVAASVRGHRGKGNHGRSAVYGVTGWDLSLIHI